MKHFIKTIFFLTAAFLFFSCRDEIKIVNWNVQTFFDANNTGEEYSNFLTSKNWGYDMYRDRVNRLAKVIKKTDAHVFVMEELENEGQLYDIYNALAGEWDLSKMWKYCCFAKTPGTSIGCGVISKLPLSDLKIHSLDVRTDLRLHKKRLRPIMQLTVHGKKNSLVLFVNHWKSMSGGKEQTEYFRLLEESVLSERMSDAVKNGNLAVACGDFNRDINDFCFLSDDQVLLRGRGEGFAAYTVWKNCGTLIEPGSYFFRGNWSRIDNFFVSDKTVVKEFTPLCDGEWCLQSGIPYSFRLGSGEGFSDHLPVKLTVDFARN